MHVNKTWGKWPVQLALALGYIGVYMALGYVSSSQWVLRAGLRLTCLLLLPYRYWPAVILAEVAPMAKISIDCYDQFGPLYAFGKLIPPIAYTAPIVWWCRSRLGLFGPRHTIRMGVLMLCILLQSLVTAARDIGLVYLGHMPDVVFSEWTSGFILGNYLGILTVVPLTLVLHGLIRETKPKALWARLSQSRLAMDSVALLLPALLLLTWIAAHAKGEFGLVSRMALFLPVAWLTLRHGWRGAAIGGFGASVAIYAINPKLYDATTMQAEAFISFAVTTLLMLGARIATLHAREKQERQESRLALQVAQEGLYLGELRLQAVADRVEDMGDAVRYAHDRLITRLNRLLPMSEERGFQKQAVATQHEIFQLADGIHPRALAKNGLSFALQHGTLAQAFGREDVPYSCDIRGVPLDNLSPGAQLALYRLACEAAIYIYEQATLSHVSVRIRIGRTGSRHWAVLQMDGLHARNREGPMPSHAECQQFRERISASGRGVEDIRNRARIYGGAARSRSTAEGTRLSLLLHDVERTSAPN